MIKAGLLAAMILPLFLIQACSNSSGEKIRHDLLAFTSGNHIYVSTWPDGTPYQVAPGNEPSISRNGRYIAYSSKIGNKRRIAITDLRLNKQWFLEDIHGASFRPQWSPSQNVVLFNALVQAGPNSQRVVVIHDPFRKKKRAITLKQSSIYSPVWSPDGQSIIAHDTRQLYEWDQKGRLIQSLPLKETFGDFSFSASDVFEPSESGKHWIFKSQDEDQPAGIYLLDSQKNITQRITPAEVEAHSFSWGPNEQSVIVAATLTSPLDTLGKGDYLIEFSLDGKLLGTHHPDASNPAFSSFITMAKLR